MGYRSLFIFFAAIPDDIFVYVGFFSFPSPDVDQEHVDLLKSGSNDQTAQSGQSGSGDNGSEVS